MQQPVRNVVERGDSLLPCSAGIGLKPVHFTELLAGSRACGWLEVHPENYLVAGGPMHHYLGKLRERYPLSFHSIGMSLGSADGVDEVHIRRLCRLCERYEPALVSDHLSWSRWQQTHLNDLLPLPYTAAALDVFCSNVDRVQNILGRSIAIENPSTYLAFANAEFDEAEFLAALARRSGATILLDINNIYVSARNHGQDADAYLQQIPASLVSEFHLAGYKVETTSTGTLLIDDHGSQVCDSVWALYKNALQRIGQRPTLIEWDTDIPALPVLLGEAAQADALLAQNGEGKRHG